LQAGKLPYSPKGAISVLEWINAPFKNQKYLVVIMDKHLNQYILEMNDNKKLI
jgi:hypothetical protein